MNRPQHSCCAADQESASNRMTPSGLVPLLLLLSLQCADAGVSSCFVCEDPGDASACAVGDSDSLKSKSCNVSDHDNEMCFVTRDKGKWTRGCFKGKNQEDVHKRNEDGSTLDTVYCADDSNCNFNDPRTQNEDGGHVQECYTCEDDGDDSNCAIGDNTELKTEKCGEDDFDNEYCCAKREAGHWTRGCSKSKDCPDDHSTNADGSTIDQARCHKDLCNSMDPRTQDDPDSSATPIVTSAATVFMLTTVIYFLNI